MSEVRTLDYLIIGAGPGGLQLGYYLERDGRDYLILEVSEAAGQFFGHYPRHRSLLSINKIYTGYDDPEVNLRWDWNSLLTDDYGLLFRDFSTDFLPDRSDLKDYFQMFAESTGLKIRYGTRVRRVSRDGDFHVLDEDGNEYRARRLIVATGLFREHVPDIPGIELSESYGEVSVDPMDFAGQRVLIIGKGNSAFETADNLLGTASLIHLVSPKPLSMAWQTHFVGNLRAVNNNLLDTYQLKAQNAVLDATVDRIEGTDEGLRVSVSYTHAHGEREDLVYDRIIRCTGFRFDGSIFDESCAPALGKSGKLPRQTPAWESVNVPSLYFAGTLTQERDYKTSTSAFIHGFRYNSRALARILAMRHQGEPWPSRTVDAEPDRLMEAVIERVNQTSALWQQFGFLGDVLSVDDDDRIRLYEEVPVDLVHDSDLVGPEYFVVTLEYGPEHNFENPFAVERIERHDVDRAEESNFLHPVIRHWSRGEPVAEHHVIEDLAAEWLEDVHTKPLQSFFESWFAERGGAVV